MPRQALGRKTRADERASENRRGLGRMNVTPLRPPRFSQVRSAISLVLETNYLRQVCAIFKFHFSTSCSFSVSNFIKTVRISLPPRQTALVVYGTYSLETVSDFSQDTRYVRQTNIR